MMMLLRRLDVCCLSILRLSVRLRHDVGSKKLTVKLTSVLFFNSQHYGDDIRDCAVACSFFVEIRRFDDFVAQRV